MSNPMQDLADLIEKGLDEQLPMILIVEGPEVRSVAQVNIPSPRPQRAAGLLLNLTLDCLEAAASEAESKREEFVYVQAMTRIQAALRVLRVDGPVESAEEE